MFTQQIVSCIEDETKRHWLKSIPIWIIASIDYMPDYIYWLEYKRVNKN